MKRITVSLFAIAMLLLVAACQPATTTSPTAELGDGLATQAPGGGSVGQAPTSTAEGGLSATMELSQDEINATATQVMAAAQGGLSATMELSQDEINATATQVMAAAQGGASATAEATENMGAGQTGADSLPSVMGAQDLEPGTFRYDISGAMNLTAEGGDIRDESTADERVIVMESPEGDAAVTLYLPTDLAPQMYTLEGESGSEPMGNTQSGSDTGMATEEAGSNTTGNQTGSNTAGQSGSTMNAIRAELMLNGETYPASAGGRVTIEEGSEDGSLLGGFDFTVTGIDGDSASEAVVVGVFNLDMSQTSQDSGDMATEEAGSGNTGSGS